MPDQEDTLDTQLAPDDQTQEEQDDAAEDASEVASEEQDAEETEATEKLYAGKYRTPEQLEAAYEEIQRFTGGRKELEEKAAAYDRLVMAQTRSAGTQTVEMPMLSNYVLEDGSIDVRRYDQHMAAYQQQVLHHADQTASKRTTELQDIARAELDFPFMKTDKEAAESAIGLYKAGIVPSIYAGVERIAKLRKAGQGEGEQKAAVTVKHELSKASRGNTERVGGKTTARETGEMTPEKFERMTPEQQQKYIQNQFNSGAWGS